MLKSEEVIILKILNDIKNKNFFTAEELKDFYKNEYDKIHLQSIAKIVITVFSY